MRKFFVLAYEDRDDLETVADYEVHDFDITQFWIGNEFSGHLPADLKLWVDWGERSDYLANPLSWQILSQRMWEEIQPLAGTDCQTLEVPLFYTKSETPVDGYVLINITRCVSASLVEDREEPSVQNLSLELSRIPDDAHLFRLAESPTIILLSEELVEQLRGKGFQGAALIRTQVNYFN